MAREHIRAFAETPGVAAAGIHSRTRTRAEKLAADLGVPAVFDSIADLYHATESHLVVVAVSESEMAPVSQACFEFPWTVLLEKPPGLNVAEAEGILACAQAKGRNALVALNRRFLSSTQTVLVDLAHHDGPRYIRVQDQEDLNQAIALGQPAAVVDHWMYANSIHVIDYLRLFGRGRITGVCHGITWNPDDPGVVVSTIAFDSGDVGLYECLWNRPGPWAVSVSTPDRRWEMRPLEQAFYQPTGERESYPFPVHRWDQEFKPGFRLQAQAAVDSALGKPSACPTLKDGVETMRLIQSIYGEA